ncbi:hypothetical protein VNI00_006555 [Paramarasmius palmivorus]|uniref:Malate dehydrogenase n=1 Tax=Paramarasmius palmivorus TaxID=297713 RepID=A0AAW0D9D1_9AGAR
MHHLLSLLPLAFAASALAAPPFRPGFSLGPPAGFPGFPGRGSLNCDVSGAIVDTAGGALTAPQKPVSFIALGVGTQNYTCSDAGTYASAGALAELFDVSCFYDRPMFNNLASMSFELWKRAPPSIGAGQVISALQGVDSNAILGEHYFVASPSGTGISPKWDFTSRAFKGNADAFILAAKQGGVPAPTGSADVDWLYLTNVQGSLADEVYRTHTKSGPPPASCAAGSAPITVKYTSLYWFTGGTIKN